MLYDCFRTQSSRQTSARTRADMPERTPCHAVARSATGRHVLAPWEPWSPSRGPQEIVSTCRAFS